MPIFNGVRFYDALRSTKDNFRYFGQYQPYDATISYNGVKYYKIKTRYDLLSDRLIVYSPGKLSFFQVKLASEKIKSFQLGPTTFIKADLSQKFNEGSNAFYELNYSSATLKLLTSWKKTEKIHSSSSSSYYTFNTSLGFYLYKDSQYYRINNKRDIIRLFPELKNEIKEFYKAYRHVERQKPKKFMEDIVFYIDRASRKGSTQ